jgi:hypothetical protein
MNFNQNFINCTVKLQRAWRMILRHRTSEKVVANVLMKLDFDSLAPLG